MMPICHFCGNKNFQKRTVQYIYWHHGNFLLVNNVPCVEREFCGEQYFEANALKKIEQDYHDIYVAGKPAKKEIRVLCEDFALV